MKQKILLFLFVFSLLGEAQQIAPSPIIFIYDASGSMWGQINGEAKVQIASQVMTKSITAMPENQRIGLVAYGHRKKGDCKDVEYIIDENSTDKNQVLSALDTIKPLGKTPLAHSASVVIDKLRQSKQKATVILVTDGIESCDGNICEVVKAAKQEGIDFKLHIIGFGLKKGETQQLQCAATAGDGKYLDAVDAASLGEYINQATSENIDEEEGNYWVKAVKNGKPIDAIVKAMKIGTKKPIDSERSYSRFAKLYLPAGKYDLEVTPLEGSKVNAITLKNIESFDDEIIEQEVNFDGGTIRINSLNNDEGWDSAVTVFQKDSRKAVARSRTYGRESKIEVNPGVYDVELKALSMNGFNIIQLIEDVEVLAGKDVFVKHQFTTGIAMIGAKNADGLIDAIVKVTDINSNKNIVSKRTYTSVNSNPKKLLINPGTYQVTVTALGKIKGSHKFTIEVKQGETVEVIKDF